MNIRDTGTLLTVLIITLLAIASVSIGVPLFSMQVKQSVETSGWLGAKTQQVCMFIYNGTEDGYPVNGNGLLGIAVTNYGLSKIILDGLVINNELVQTCIVLMMMTLEGLS